MTTQRTITTLLTLAGAALLVAGCSSAETKNEYIDTVNKIQADALDAVNEATATSPDDKGQVVDQLEAAERILGKAESELEAVDVPSEAESSHAEMVAGIERMKKLFAKTANSISRSDDDAEAFAELTGLVSESSAIGAEIDAAIAQINQDLGAE